MSKLNKGEVAITLSGTEYTLKPTLTAFSTLGARFENWGELLSKIAAGNIPAMIVVLRYGLGFNDAQSKKLPDLVFSTGVATLTEPLSDYVYRLFNSGKSVEEVIAERLTGGTGSDSAGGGDEENPLMA